MDAAINVGACGAAAWIPARPAGAGEMDINSPFPVRAGAPLREAA